MNRLLAIAVIFGVVNSAFGQSSQADKILAEWWSTKTYKKVPVRTLVFKKDSSYTETVNGSLGSISAISKYHFANTRLVLGTVQKEVSDVIFYGNNKFKFARFSDSLTDYMYKLTFKRRK